MKNLNQLFETILEEGDERLIPYEDLDPIFCGFGEACEKSALVFKGEIDALDLSRYINDYFDQRGIHLELDDYFV